MDVTIAPNKIHKSEQKLDFGNEKIITLIGENGSGKSAILEKVFTEYIADTKMLLISFTSGQNESFTRIFSTHLAKSRRYLVDAFAGRAYHEDAEHHEDEASLSSFHFDTSWVRLLIFFATTIKPEGLTRKFLIEKGIIEVSADSNKDDLSTYIWLQLRILTRYLHKLDSDDAAESLDSNKLPIRKSVIHRLLEKLITHFKPDYDFTAPSVLRWIKLTSVDAFRILGKNERDIFTFLGYALRHNTFIISQSILLHFKENLELNDLSDGEFQLLSIYALIDLFDSEQTLFLFDEIDSHVHYKNSAKLWNALREIKGKLLTTTHSADSMLLHPVNNIRLVSNGKIETELTAEHLFKRMEILSENQTYIYKIAAKFEYIALVENRFDWFVFLELAKRKIPEYNPVMEQIQPVKCSSGFNVINQVFADSRKNWVNDFARVNGTAIKTQAIFFVCDRDNLPIANISIKNGVSVTGQDAPRFANNTRTPYILAWKRREIENYLLSATMLAQNNLLQPVNNLLPGISPLTQNNNGDNDPVRNLDVKNLLQPLYIKDGLANAGTHEEGVDYAKLKQVINQIPPEEISEDIVNMYNFIVPKLTP